MKRNSKLIICLALVLVLSLSCLSLIGCSKKHVCESKCEVCGKCTDLECTEKACSDKCQGHDDPTPGPSHECAHKCETCGKCTDESCADSVCSDKCQGHEAEYISIPITGEVRYDLGVLKGFAEISNVTIEVSETDENEAFITNFNWENNSSVTMEIWSNAEEDVQGDFVMRVRKTSQVITLTSQINVEINGDVLESEAQVPSSMLGESASFVEVNLGKFWLSPGLNTMVIKPQSNIANFDFSGVIFYTCEEANLEWNAMKGVNGDLLLGTDDHVTFTGDYVINLGQNCLGVGGYGHASATFPVYSSRKAKTNIYIVTNSMPVSVLVTDYFNFTINDEKITSNAYMPTSSVLWGNYVVTKVGEYVVEEGLNNIKLDVSDNIIGKSYEWFYNLRGIILETEAKVGFEEQEKEAHVCISVCETCGGCLEKDCSDEACKTKCDCAHKCESVCSICGGCLNDDCTEEVCEPKCSCVSQTIYATTSAVVEQGSVNEEQNCVGCKTLDNNSWRTKLYYLIDAEKAGEAELSIIISSTTGGNYTATDVYMTTINSQTYTSEALTVNDGIAWMSYHTIYLGVIDLVEGENVIAFDHYHITDLATAAVSNWGESVNFRGIVLNTAVNYQVTHDVCINKCETCGGCLDPDCKLSACATKCSCKHECEHVCNVCNGCKDADCTDTVCETKCSCVSQTLDAVIYAVVEQGSPNSDENCVGCKTLDNNSWRTKLYYTINAEKAGKAELSIIISSTTGGNYTATDVYMTTINSQTYTSEALTVNDGVAYMTYHTIYLGVIDLVEGENVIAFDHYHITDFAAAAVTNWGDGVNFRGIILNSNVACTVEATDAE